MKKPNRRSFLQNLASASLIAPAAFSGCADSAPAVQSVKGKSRVAVARRPGTLLLDGTAQPNEITGLLEKSMCALFNEKKAVNAWKKIFSSDDVVGIKVNALGGKGISPRPEVVTAICTALQAAGVRPERIIVWDRFSRELQRAGYTIVTEGSRPRCFGTDALEDGGYERQIEMSGTIGSCFSRIQSGICTATINLGVLKDHDLSGISVAMKNLFGLIHNPNRYHFDVHKDPYLPDLAAHPYVRDKSRLVVIDAITAQYNGGPAYKPEFCWPYEGLLVGTDAVAIDRIGYSILKEKKQEAGVPSLAEIGREPKYIEIAEEKGLGNSDLSKIDVVEVS